MTIPVVTIGLVSDTHGWLDPFCLEAFDGADLIVHAGDIGRPHVLDQLREVAPLLVVKGNIDGDPLHHLPLVDVAEVAGKRVASLHIAGTPWRPKPRAVKAIRDTRADLFVVGHSHMWAVGQVEGALWVNPGAAGRQGFHKQRTAARVHLDVAGEWSLERLELGPRGRPKARVG